MSSDRPPIPMSFAQAISVEEGFFVPGSRANRNKNPGNLDFEPWQFKFGAVIEPGPNGRFAVFETDSQGFAAMSSLLVHAYSGLTVAQAIAKWAPSSENNTNQYIANVCTWTQFTPETILVPLLLQPPGATNGV